MRYPKQGKSGWGSALCANGAFIFLLLAGVAFTCYAMTTAWNSRRLDDSVLLDRAVVAAAKLAGQNGGAWSIRAFARETSATSLEVVIGGNGKKRSFELTLDSEGSVGGQVAS